jgi:hypothetical protein
LTTDLQEAIIGFTMRRIEQPIGTRLTSFVKQVAEILTEQRVLEEVNRGDRTPESLHAERGIESLMYADPNKTTPYITELLAGMSGELPARYLAIRVMTRIMDIAKKRYPMPETAAPWMAPIAEVIPQDTENGFQLDSETIRNFFASFPYESAIDDLLNAAPAKIRRRGERVSHERITNDTIVRVVGKDTETGMAIVGEHMRHWYLNQYEAAYPVAEGVLESFRKMKKPPKDEIKTLEDQIILWKQKPICRIEPEVNDISFRTFFRESAISKETFPEFPGEYTVDGKRVKGTLVMHIHQAQHDDKWWHMGFREPGHIVATEVSFDEASSLQEALDIAVTKGFVPELAEH